jgi:hypothetical protein
MQHTSEEKRCSWLDMLMKHSEVVTRNHAVQQRRAAIVLGRRCASYLRKLFVHVEPQHTSIAVTHGSNGYESQSALLRFGSSCRVSPRWMPAGSTVTAGFVKYLCPSVCRILGLQLRRDRHDNARQGANLVPIAQTIWAKCSASSGSQTLSQPMFCPGEHEWTAPQHLSAGCRSFYGVDDLAIFHVLAVLSKHQRQPPVHSCFQ